MRRSPLFFILALLTACSGTTIEVKSVVYGRPARNKIIRIADIRVADTFVSSSAKSDIRRFLRFSLEKRGFRVLSAQEKGEDLTLDVFVKSGRIEAGVDEKYTAMLDLVIFSKEKRLLNVLALYESDTPLIAGRQFMRVTGEVSDTISSKLKK